MVLRARLRAYWAGLGVMGMDGLGIASTQGQTGNTEQVTG